MQAPVTQLPATEAAAQPTSTVKTSGDLALQNNAAETAPPVPKANPAPRLWPGSMSTQVYICTLAIVILSAGLMW